MSFSFIPSKLPGVVIVEPPLFQDARGFFLEVYKESEFARAGLPTKFVQENHSGSGRGVLRGLHYQRAPKAQGKLVRALAGEIFDVVVDLRQGSPTCGQWVGIELSAAGRNMLYVPPWCAHGFCVLSERAEIAYLVTEEYSPQDEGGIAWNDARLGIRWPVADPALSARDRQWGPFEPLPESMFAAAPALP